MDALSAGVVGGALRRAQRSLEPERVPLMGMTAAFLFAAQMINFPVAGGTSGHLLGGFLAALLLGPAPAIVVMTTVFAVQCLLFQDGGLLALGANLFNMGILGCLGGYAVYRLLLGFRRGGARDPSPLGDYVPERPAEAPATNPLYGPAVAVGAWVSVMLGAGAASLELAASGTIPLRVVLPA